MSAHNDEVGELTPVLVFEPVLILVLDIVVDGFVVEIGATDIDVVLAGVQNPHVKAHCSAIKIVNRGLVQSDLRFAQSNETSVHGGLYKVPVQRPQVTGHSTAITRESIGS